MSTTASASEIKLAYKRLAVLYHPDKHKGSTLYEDLFKAVATAYHTLGDANRRAQYDYQLQAAARRAEEQRRQQQFRAQSQHLYGVPMPPPAPLRTRRPAGSAERHYRTIPRKNIKFTRRDYWLVGLVLLGLLLLGLSVKVTMDYVTAGSNYDQGIEAYAHRDWGTAHGFFSETLRFKPEHVQALQRRAELSQLVYHDYQNARRDYSDALAEAAEVRQQALLLWRLGQCQSALQQSDSAQLVFNQAISLDTTLARARLARGEYELFEKRRYVGAIRDFSAGLRHTKEPALTARLLLFRGLARYKLRDFGAARADYWQVLTLTPRSGQVYFLLGRVAQQEGSLPDACEFFRRAVVQGYTFAETVRTETCGPLVQPEVGQDGKANSGLPVADSLKVTSQPKNANARKPRLPRTPADLADHKAEQ